MRISHPDIKLAVAVFSALPMRLLGARSKK